MSRGGRVWTIGQFVRMEIPGTGMRKYDSKKALPAPNRKVARTTLAGSRRLSIEAIVQRTSIEGAMAAAPRVDGRAAIISLARRSIGWLPIKEELSPRTAYWQSFNGCVYRKLDSAILVVKSAENWV